MVSETPSDSQDTSAAVAQLGGEENPKWRSLDRKTGPLSSSRSEFLPTDEGLSTVSGSLVAEESGARFGPQELCNYSEASETSGVISTVTEHWLAFCAIWGSQLSNHLLFLWFPVFFVSVNRFGF